MCGDIEKGICNFCLKEKIVSRTYLRPTKYVKPEKFEVYNNLYNQGDYFIIIFTCDECGVPKI